EEAMGVIRRYELGSEPHIRRDGINLSNTSQSSPAACQTLCDNNSSCNSWAYDNSSGTCWLHADVGYGNPDIAFTSGVSASRLETGVDHFGSDYWHGAAVSAGSCSTMCSRDAHCLAFTYRKSSKVCYLKEYVAAASSNSDAISGVKRGLEYFTDRPGSNYT